MIKKSTIPVRIGDQIDVKLISDGKNPNTKVAKVRGYVIFVQDCNETTGKVISIKIEKTLTNFAFAKEVK